MRVPGFNVLASLLCSIREIEGQPCQTLGAATWRNLLFACRGSLLKRNMHCLLDVGTLNYTFCLMAVLVSAAKLYLQPSRAGLFPLTTPTHSLISGTLLLCIGLFHALQSQRPSYTFRVQGLGFGDPEQNPDFGLQ